MNTYCITIDRRSAAASAPASTLPRLSFGSRQGDGGGGRAETSDPAAVEAAAACPMGAIFVSEAVAA